MQNGGGRRNAVVELGMIGETFLVADPLPNYQSSDLLDGAYTAVISSYAKSLKNHHP